MKHKTAEETLRESIRKWYIESKAFPTEKQCIEYADKHLAITEELQAILSAMEAYRSQPSQDSKNESDLYKALEKIDEGNLGSAKNLIKRFINTSNNQPPK